MSPRNQRALIGMRGAVGREDHVRCILQGDFPRSGGLTFGTAWQIVYCHMMQMPLSHLPNRDEISVSSHIPLWCGTALAVADLPAHRWTLRYCLLSEISIYHLLFPNFVFVLGKCREPSPVLCELPQQWECFCIWSRPCLWSSQQNCHIHHRHRGRRRRYCMAYMFMHWWASIWRGNEHDWSILGMVAHM